MASVFKCVLTELLQRLFLFLLSLDPCTREELVEESSQGLDQHFLSEKDQDRKQRQEKSF